MQIRLCRMNVALRQFGILFMNIILYTVHTYPKSQKKVCHAHCQIEDEVDGG